MHWLDQYKSGGFPAGYPASIASLYSPVDKVHQAILDTIKSAKHSLVIALYGWDDEDVQRVTLEKMKNKNVYVQLTLDSSQAAGSHEKKLLAMANFPATSVAIGRSEKGAIMHLKCIVVDSTTLITGSTNFSASGETKQDNACVIIHDAYVAGEAVSRIAAIHTSMLQKNAAK